MFRKPQDDSEEKRVKELDIPLGILSLIVNAYDATEFKGKLCNVIKLEEGVVLATIFLDNDNIAILLETSIVKLNIYNRLSGELIKSVDVSPPGAERSSGSRVRMVITNTRNILISCYLSLKTSIKEISRMQVLWFYNQEGELLWYKMDRSYVDAIILNDNTLFLSKVHGVKLVNRDEEKVLKFKSGKKNNNPSLLSNTIIPHGKRGFICYSQSKIFCYDNNWEEKKVLEVDGLSKITALEIVDKDTIIYGTSDTNLVIYDMREEKEIFMRDLPGNKLKIRGIKLLPHGRCLVVLNPYRQDDERNNTIYILNLKCFSVEKKYYSDGFTKYIGITSKEQVIFTLSSPYTVVVYDILKKEDTTHNIGDHDVFGLSSFDSIITINESTNQVSIFE
jgi:hypothetical protein